MKANKNDFIRGLRESIQESPARDLLHDLTLAYTKYMNINHLFLTGVGLTSIEAHTLKHICQNPGVTITDIVNYWGRTKGTVSAQISALEEKGLVIREKREEDKKRTYIYPTEKGLSINEYHAQFDIEESSRWIEKWLKKYTLEESEDFWEKLRYYKEFLDERIKDSSL